MSNMELRLAGSGGQGVILATVILAEAAILAGKYTAQSQAYGPEARGGSCKAEVLISEAPIGFTKVQKPTFLMVLTQKALDDYGHDLPENCVVLADESLQIPQELNLLANAIVSFSCAMQVQTFRKVNGYAYASTMCIGNMRSGMEALAVWIVKHDPKALRKVFHYLGIIFLFGVGAGLGWVAVEHFATRAIWWSCLLLVICFALMFIREDLEANPAIEQDLAEIRQEAGEIDHLLKEELHEEHEALRGTLEHKH